MHCNLMCMLYIISLQWFQMLAMGLLRYFYLYDIAFKISQKRIEPVK